MNTTDVTPAQRAPRVHRWRPARGRKLLMRSGQLGLGVLLAAAAAAPATPAQAAASTLFGGAEITTLERASTGTAGLVVHDRVTGKPMLLTNYHVVGSKYGSVQIGQNVVEFGPAQEYLGITTRAKYDGGSNDMAVATLAKGVDYNGSIRGFGMPSGIGEPRENSTVFMYDRVNKKAVVSGRINPGAIRHDDFYITPDPSSDGFATYGDSGSVIVDEFKRVVGLLDGCSAVSCHATRMSTVLDAAHMDARLLDPDRQSIPLFRYYHPGTKKHFYTTRWQELGPGSDDGGWKFEVQAGSVLKVPRCIAGECATPLYRYSNVCTGDRLYTINYSELGGGNSCWRLEGHEGFVFRTQVAGTVPLYRFYNPNTDEHFYTMYPSTISSNPAWRPEGAVFVYPTFGM